MRRVSHLKRSTLLSPGPVVLNLRYMRVYNIGNGGKHQEKELKTQKQSCRVLICKEMFIFTCFDLTLGC